MSVAMARRIIDAFSDGSNLLRASEDVVLETVGMTYMPVSERHDSDIFLKPFTIPTS